MTVNMAWPRASVYDPGGDGFVFQWFSVLLLLGTAVTGVIAYAYLRRNARVGVVQAGEVAAAVQVTA